MKLDTVNLKGNEYALVPVRLKAFREDNPFSDIQSKPHWNEDGSCDFETRIIKNQKEEASAKGTGWAHYSKKEMEAPKAYEKLATISTGRALSNLGYLNNGEVASTEELEEFYESKISDFEKRIDEAESVEDLMSIFNEMNAETKQLLTERLSARKKEINEGN